MGTVGAVRNARVPALMLFFSFPSFLPSPVEERSSSDYRGAPIWTTGVTRLGN
jgi:hypothetical protein